MKVLHRAFAIMISVGSLCSVSIAMEASQITAYRGLDGTFDHASRQNIREMRRAARSFGEIEIWVTFDMEFVGNPDLRTPEIIEAEAEVREQHISQVIQPIVDRGNATLLDVPVGLEQAPGCLVSVTARGLGQVVRNPAVKHIEYTIFSE